MQNKRNEAGFLTYLFVWISLIVLTAFTVTVAALNLGKIAVLTALSIASFKSLMVLNFFMHLKYEDRLFHFMLLLSVITLSIIIGFTFFDISFR